jgi:uncharacterized phiE125 gp8 family phage protein
MIGPNRVGAAAVVVALEDAKAHLRVDEDDENDLITAFVAAATEMVAGLCGLILGSESWQFKVGPVSGQLMLPVAPVTALSAISWLDADEVSVTGDVADFILIADAARPYVQPVTGGTWPVVARRDDAVTITVAAGLSVLPDALKVAILMVTEQLYEHRGAESGAATLPGPVRSLIEMHKRQWVAA